MGGGHREGALGLLREKLQTANCQPRGHSSPQFAGPVALNYQRLLYPYIFIYDDRWLFPLDLRAIYIASQGNSKFVLDKALDSYLNACQWACRSSGSTMLVLTNGRVGRHTGAVGVVGAN